MEVSSPLEWFGYYEGDYISLITAYASKLWVAPTHTFFGAYKIGASANCCPPAENCVKS